MRGRRNTGLSLSTSSMSSTNSSPIILSDTDWAEKGRFLLLPDTTGNEPLPSPLVKAAAEESRRQPAWRRAVSRVSRQTLLLASVCSLLALWRLFVFVSTLSSSSSLHFGTVEYELAAAAPSSTRPEPVILRDSLGRMSWTMSIPANSTFPLQPSQYRDMCLESLSVSMSINRDTQQYPRRSLRRARAASYYAIDSSYVDVPEAEAQGILPSSSGQKPIASVGRDSDAERELSGSETCHRSLTFVLETEEAGFGKSLLSLWTSYGLAKREGRAFFIDDSRWQYGKYLSFFPVPPQPPCRAPPPTHIVPCPHQAAHLAVSAATLKYTFGVKFHSFFTNTHRPGIARQKSIFSMARHGYEALFQLIGEDAELAQHRVSSIRERAEAGHYPVVGMHVRRGDRHPFEPEFHADYLPLERFTNSAIKILAATPRPAPANLSEPVPITVASDDPDTVTSPDLQILAALSPSTPFRPERVQERIVLASKKNLVPTVPQRFGNGAFVKHVDEVSGWEGGFFASLFRALGKPSRADHLTFHSAKEHRLQVEERRRRFRERMRGQSEPSERERKEEEERKRVEENASAMRELVGRGYLMDLAVLGQSDHVVCAVSSATCRALAVVMGWDKVKAGKWVNVDDGRQWSLDGEH